MGRWVSRDPIEEDGGVHLYAFISNNGPLGLDALGCERVGVVFGPDNNGAMQYFRRQIEEIRAEWRQDGRGRSLCTYDFTKAAFAQAVQSSDVVYVVAHGQSPSLEIVDQLRDPLQRRVTDDFQKALADLGEYGSVRSGDFMRDPALKKAIGFVQAFRDRKRVGYIASNGQPRWVFEGTQEFRRVSQTVIPARKLSYHPAKILTSDDGWVLPGQVGWPTTASPPVLLAGCYTYWMDGLPGSVKRITWRAHSIDWNDSSGNPYPVLGIGSSYPDRILDRIRSGADASVSTSQGR
jgi:hypothetical protein